MTQEDKELLLKDLCARLPYGVKIQIPELFRPSVQITETLVSIDNGHINDSGMKIEFVKPYLRIMSSMIEEERKEFNSSCVIIYDEIKGKTILYTIETIDWLNSHYFDYRGLIPKGLAIEVTKENNPYKE